MSSITNDNKFFGHPSGLTTLFFTEMWERMSYYGMRALLIYFMTASLQEGGLALTVASATAIYGLYTGCVYFMGLPGGWLADRLIGGQKAVWYGGIIIMCGHIVLALPYQHSLYIGLVLVVLGTGLLKPNVGALVGRLYSDNDNRRDSGYAIYYMGINIGAMVGALVCGYISKNVGWHPAFAAAAVGMALGLMQYRKTLTNLGDAGLKPTAPLSEQGKKITLITIFAVLGLLTVVSLLAINGTITLKPQIISDNTTIIFTIIFFAYYLGIFIFGKLNSNETKKLIALLLVCFASACFWAGFEQAGSSLSLFAQDYTNLMIGNYAFPAQWFQSLNPAFIIILTPFMAAIWINIGKKLVTPAYGIKCAVGIVIMASGFIVMFFAAQLAASGLKVAPYWLVATYFLHTVGELCLSPVALSAVSKLSPKRFSGQMMGLFVLTYSLGNLIAGKLAGHYDPENVEQIPNLYLQISTFSIGIAIVILLLSLKTRFWEQLPDTDMPKSTETSKLQSNTP